MFKRRDWIFSRNPDAAVGADSSSSEDEVAALLRESSDDLFSSSDDLVGATAGAPLPSWATRETSA